MKFHDVGCNHKKPVICEEALAVTVPAPLEPDVVGNHHYGGQGYHLSWVGGVHNLSWDNARQYCDNLGMRLVTLHDEDIRQHFFTEV